MRSANWDILFLTGTILSIINIMEDTNRKTPTHPPTRRFATAAGARSSSRPT
jgi:hypothetical protein